MTSKEAYDKYRKAIEDGNAVLLLAESESRELSSEERDRFDRTHKDAQRYLSLSEDMTRMEEVEKRAVAREQHEREQRIRRVQANADPKALEKRASEIFERYVRYGLEALNQEQRQLMRGRWEAHDADTARFELRQQATTPGSAGGYTVPRGFQAELEKALAAFGGMFSMAESGQNTPDAPVRNLRTASGNNIDWPTADDSTQKGERKGENSPINQQDIAFGQTVLQAFTYTSKLILISWELLEDTGINIAGEIASIGGTRVARIVNEEMTVGTGSGMPEGVAVAAPSVKTVANADWTSAPNAGNVKADLLDLEHGVDRAYRSGASSVFMLRDEQLKVLRSLSVGASDDRLLWQPSMRDGAPATINGRPYVLNDDLPDLNTTGNKFLLYGDFSKYIHRTVSSSRLIRLDELYAANGQTGFFWWSRHDGRLNDAGGNPIKALAAA